MDKKHWLCSGNCQVPESERAGGWREKGEFGESNAMTRGGTQKLVLSGWKLSDSENEGLRNSGSKEEEGTQQRHQCPLRWCQFISTVSGNG